MVIDKGFNSAAKLKMTGKKTSAVVTFDADARKEYLTGFSKRRHERQIAGRLKEMERERKKRLEARKQKRKAEAMKRGEYEAQHPVEEYDEEPEVDKEDEEQASDEGEQDDDYEVQVATYEGLEEDKQVTVTTQAIDTDANESYVPSATERFKGKVGAEQNSNNNNNNKNNNKQKKLSAKDLPKITKKYKSTKRQPTQKVTTKAQRKFIQKREKIEKKRKRHEDRRKAKARKMHKN